MTTKFRQKYATIAHILVLYKIWRHFTCTMVLGVGEFQYAISFFSENKEFVFR